MRLLRRLTLGAFVLVAFSAPPAAEAAEAGLVVPTCAAVVEGAAGTEVTVLPQALVEPVVTSVRSVDGLSLVGEAVRTEWSTAPPISVGRIGDGYLPGARIADAAIARLAEIPAARPVLSLLAPAVHETLSPVCGIATRVELPRLPRLPVDPPPASPQPADPPPSAAPTAAPSHVPEPLAADGTAAGAVPRAEQRAPREWPWPAGRRVVGDLDIGSRELEMSAGRTELTASSADSVADERASWLLFSAAVLLAFAAGSGTRYWGRRG